MKVMARMSRKRWNAPGNLAGKIAQLAAHHFIVLQCRLAWRRTMRPAPVNLKPSGSRSNCGIPSSSSSFLIWRLSARGRHMQFSDALRRAGAGTAAKYFSDAGVHGVSGSLSSHS